MTSLLFRTAAKLILPLSLTFAAFMTFKGHNAPGGGFIGGLTAAVSLMIFAMACGRNALLQLIPVHPRVLIGGGLLISVTTSALPLLWGNPMLTSTVIDAFPIGWGQSIHFVTAFFFDVGVMLVVIGVSTGMIQRLGEELLDASDGVAATLHGPGHADGSLVEGRAPEAAARHADRTPAADRHADDVSSSETGGAA